MGVLFTLLLLSCTFALLWTEHECFITVLGCFALSTDYIAEAL